MERQPIGEEAKRKAKEEVRDVLGRHGIQASFIGFDTTNFHIKFHVDPTRIDEARNLLPDVPPENIQPTQTTRRGSL